MPPLKSSAYSTPHGEMYCGSLQSFLAEEADAYAGKVDLIFTSPPFPLTRAKSYGNKQGQEYVDWLASFAPALASLLAPSGSIVVEVGNSWVPGKPVMSTLALRALLAFLDRGDLHLCQQFICHNPARLPTPAQWVNIERIRVKDSYTHVWWMSPTERPKANNRRVLKPYSDAMKRLLKKKKYNAGKRPSGHDISQTSFLSDHGGAIPPSVLLEPGNLLVYSNTGEDAQYRAYCDSQGLPVHPARMQEELVRFFVSFLTEEGDLILDPFAGSNTSGAISQELGRRWLAVEQDADFVRGSLGRFDDVEEVDDEFV